MVRRAFLVGADLRHAPIETSRLSMNCLHCCNQHCIVSRSYLSLMHLSARVNIVIDAFALGGIDHFLAEPWQFFALGLRRPDRSTANHQLL